jgi:hypothetical protein
MKIVLSSIVNVIRGTYIYGHVTSTSIFILKMNEIFVGISYKCYEESGYNFDLDLLIIFVPIGYFIS